MKVSSDYHSPNFRAKLLSRWLCSSKITGEGRNIFVASLEKHDSSFADKFIKSLDNYTRMDSIKKDILTEAAGTMKKILETGGDMLKKIKIFLAIWNETPCGILIANIPKEDEYGNIVYSSRHNCAKNETELDWLATWTPNPEDKIGGIGKTLIGEYFKTVGEDKFRDVYVRSELPENSYAQSFYESLGFEVIGDKRVLWGAKTSNKALIRKEDDPVNDRVIPMIATRKNIKRTFHLLSENMNRQEIAEGKSTDISDLIKI